MPKTRGENALVVHVPDQTCWLTKDLTVTNRRLRLFLCPRMRVFLRLLALRQWLVLKYRLFWLS